MYRETYTDQPTDQPTDQVIQMLVAFSAKTLSTAEIMESLNLKHRPTFRENYMKPAIKQGLVDLLHPDNLNHLEQKYFLTKKGKSFIKSR